MPHPKIHRHHQERLAVVYVRQSTPQQMTRHPESTRLQYGLVDRALMLGWSRSEVLVIDEDLGKSGSTAQGRSGFQRLVTEVSLNRVGLVLGIEMSRLARSCRDWYQLLEVCGLFATLIGDWDGVYDPADYNDRLLLGLKGTMSEAELYLIKQRMLAGKRAKAERGELGMALPRGYIRQPSGEVAKDPDAQVQSTISLVFSQFERLNSIHGLLQYLVRHQVLFKFKGVGFGPVTGSLMAGLLIGYFFHVPVSDTAKQLLFLLFMYGIGYSAGPGFIRGIQDGGWRWVVLGTVIPVTGVLTAVTMARLLNLELGYAAGMMSGGLTESPVIGTASEAIRSLPISDAEKIRLIQQIPIADALTYIFGTFGVIFFCAYIGPWILRLDLKAAALKLEAEMGIERQQAGVTSAWHMYELRAYRLDEGQPLIGRTVAQAESAVAPERLFIERIRRGERLIEATPDEVLERGDVIAVLGANEALLRIAGAHAQEVYDRPLLDIDSPTFDVELSNRKYAGRTLAELRQEPVVRGVFLQAIRRGSESIPIGPGTVVQRGDMLTIHGLSPAIDRVSALIGVVARPSSNTDFVALGLAIFVGALLGVSVTFPVNGLHIALGSSVAVLLVGLAMGWRNSTRPLFAYIPPGAVEFMKSIGLAAFVAMIGLKAGPVFVDALKEIGLTVFLGGVVVTLVPQFVGLFVGRYLLGLNPLLLLGALAGAQTMTAGLAAVQERSESPVAVIGYSSTVAFGHILISIGGTALVWMLK